MASKKGTLTIRVVSDTKAAEKGLDRFNTKVSSTGDKLQDAGKKMTLFATVPVAAAMGAATKAASDLQQAVGGTEAVFGDARDEIDRYAKSAAQASGLSEREFREATTSIGGQLKRMTGDVDLAAEQSVQLTRVAADLAATYGGTTAEAVDALGAAFRGEADPAERFNLNLKIGAVNAKAVAMGLAESEQQVSESARAQATLALVMEQSADAQGQFARESDSAAGSMQIARAEMENASAEIGEALLPHVADLAGGVADLAQAFGDLPEGVQTGILAISGLIALAGPMTTAAGTIVNVWGKAGSALETAGIGALYAKDRIGTLAKTVGGVAVGVGAIFAIKEGLDALGLSARGLEVDIEGAARATTDELLVNFQKLNDFDTGAALELFRITAEGSIGTAKRLRDALAAAGEDTSALDAILRDVAEGERQAAEDGEAAADALGDVGDAAGGAKKPMRDFRNETKSAAEQQEELEDRIRAVTDAIRAQLDPLFATQDAFQKHADAQDAVKAAQMEALVAQQNLDAAIKEHGRKSDEAALASLELAAAQQRVKDANSETARTALDVATAAVELQQRVKDGTVSVEESEAQLRLWAEQGLLTEEQAYQIAEELRGVISESDRIDGRNMKTTLSLDAQQFWMELAAARFALAETQVTAQLGGARTTGPQIRHQGGRGQAGRAYLVGRPGHEELFVPDESGRFLSGHETDRAMRRGAGSRPGAAAGGPLVVIENLNSYDRPTGQSIAHELRRVQLMSV